MSELNTKHNRAVWFDIPVADLDRAIEFYRSVLAIGIDKESFDGSEFAVLEHSEGNGGCLVPGRDNIADHGVLLYLNVDGRIRAAVGEVETAGGSVLEPVHAIGPHGFRAVIRDSEGNRVALHSEADG